MVQIAMPLSHTSKLFFTLSVCIFACSLLNIFIAMRFSDDYGSATSVQTILQTSVSKNVVDRNNGVLLLKTTDASSIQMKEKAFASTRRSPYSIDILIVGSKNNTSQAKAQRDTWASHEAVRHFFLSTEYDDTNPRCTGNEDWTNDDLVKYIRPCRTGHFWHMANARNPITDFVKNGYTRFKWLKERSNPKGWLCAQKRFVTSFTTLVQMYAETKSLPDYLIVADDDTYVNIDHIVKMMISDPEELEAKGENQELSMFPTSNTPIVLAGCKIRAPNHKLTWLSPFGGYGVFFSKGSLKRLIQPLYCNDDASEFERGSCNKLLYKENNSYPLNATIAEERFFEIGDSLNQVFYKYTREIEHFCLHSDWFLGYIANFYNISRHTVGGNYWDDRKTDVQENRLHSFKDSEIYTTNKPLGQCLYGGENGKDCDADATVCHHMNITNLRKVHYEAALKLKEQ